MADFFIWGWWYMIPFLVVLGISYLFSILLLRFTRRFFTKNRDLFIFSFSVLFIIATLVSWAFAIDLFIKIPYRPIEFLGEPFWIPNIVLLIALLLFGRGQIRKKQVELSPAKDYKVTTIVAWILFCVAIVLLIYTRQSYLDRIHDRVLVFSAPILNQPEWCSKLKTYRGLQDICVLRSLNVSYPEEVNECEYFSPAYNSFKSRCYEAKAIRDNDPSICSNDTLEPGESANCISNFIGTEEWAALCENFYRDYPRSRFMEYAYCSSSDSLKDAPGENSSDEMLAYKIKQPALNSGRIVSIQYESIPRCDSFTTSDTFSINFGDGQVGRADCKGIIEHEYSALGTYKVSYIKNGTMISSLEIEIE